VKRLPLKKKWQKNDKILEALASNLATPEFVKFDKAKMTGSYVRLPERKELNQEINEALVVE
jgi:small subunit ribosomal protein S4